MLLKRAPVQEPPTPPALQVADERYLLSTRREVLSVMQALAKWPVPVSVNLAQLRETAPCRLIAVNPAYEELVFDASGLSGVARLDGSGGLVAEAQLDAVWYRFESSNVEAVQGHGGKAFRARMPPVVARVQRRNSVRYPVPGVNPPVCEVRNEVGVAARLQIGRAHV